MSCYLITDDGQPVDEIGLTGVDLAECLFQGEQVRTAIESG